MKISYKLERLDCMHENKIFFLLFFYIMFCNILEKIKYFNTRFVSLHHKFFKRFFFNYICVCV
jgi:hypothetical protein